MPNGCAAPTMAADGMTAAPAVPAIRAAPARALVPIITAPIPTGAMPAVVIPTIVLVIEGKVLDPFDRLPALPRAKRPSRPLGDTGLGAARQGRKEEPEQKGDARKQANHCSPFSGEDLAQRPVLRQKRRAPRAALKRRQFNRLCLFGCLNAANRR